MSFPLTKRNDHRWRSNTLPTVYKWGWLKNDGVSIGEATGAVGALTGTLICVRGHDGFFPPR